MLLLAVSAAPASAAVRCTYGSFRCRNRRIGDELWLMRCFASSDRMLKFRFGA